MNERFVLTPGQEEKERDSGIKVSNRRKKNPLTICEKLAKQRTTSRPFFDSRDLRATSKLYY